jgi:hypothetical protein
MKNPMAIMAAIAVGFMGILSGKEKTAWELRRNPFTRKHKVGHNEGIAKGATYNKAILRCQARSKKPDWAVRQA